MADPKKPDIEKGAGNLAGKLLDGVLGATPLGTIVFGVNEVIKRTGGGDKAAEIKNAVTDGAGKLAADAARPAASGVQGVVDKAKAEAAALVEKTRVAAEKAKAGAWPGEVEKQDPTNIPVETRNPRANEGHNREIRGREGVVGNIGGGPGTSPSTVAAPASVAPTAAAPAAASQGPSAHDVAYSHDQWASGAVHGTVAVATAKASAAAATPKLSAKEQAVQEVQKFRDNLKTHMKGKSEASILKAAFDEVRKDYEVRKLRNQATPEDEQRLKALEEIARDKKGMAATLAAPVAAPAPAAP